MPLIRLHLDDDLCTKIRTKAARSHVSVSQWLIDAINQRLKADEDREWREGFEAMAKDPECNDVEYAFHAQSEVVRCENAGY